MIILPYPVTSKRSHFQVLLAYDFEFSVGMLEYSLSIGRRGDLLTQVLSVTILMTVLPSWNKAGVEWDKDCQHLRTCPSHIMQWVSCLWPQAHLFWAAEQVSLLTPPSYSSMCSGSGASNLHSQTHSGFVVWPQASHLTCLLPYMSNRDNNT